MYSGQAMVHTSGALDADVLAPAMAAGTQVGAFHPLVAFADTERAVADLHGATIAIEADDQLADLLARMAEAIGGRPVRLAPGSQGRLPRGGRPRGRRPRRAARCDRRARPGRRPGRGRRPGHLRPAHRRTLANARALGVDAALTGPITRGDTGTLRGHLAALRAHAPDVLEPLYRAAAEREIAIAARRGALAPERAATLRSTLASPD